MTNRRFRSIFAACALTLLPWLGAPASAQTGDVRMEWLSWSIFRLTAPNGTVVLTNPFIKNPDSKVTVADFPKVDVILVADGHGDEVGSTDEIAIPTKAAIITTFEMWSAWFEPRKVPMSQVRRGNPGDWNKFDGVTIRNVNSVHGSGTPDKFYGGQAMGFIMHFDNGLNVYFAGSTAVTRDMELWAASTSRTSRSCRFPAVATSGTSSKWCGSCGPAIRTSRRSSRTTTGSSPRPARRRPPTWRRRSRTPSCRSRC